MWQHHMCSFYNRFLNSGSTSFYALNFVYCQNSTRMSNKADKLQKQAIKDQLKRIKPGECQKYVRLVLDTGIERCSFGKDLIRLLKQSDLLYDLRSLPERNCIIWERNVGQQTISHGSLEDAWQMENQILHILDEAAFKWALKSETLHCIGPKLQVAFPQCKYTLVLPRLRQNKSNNESSVLIELQFLHELHVVQLEQPESKELLALLHRHTKAIAEAPFKQQRNETLGSFKKYLANDKKQCVRIEQGHGYGRLWQQHLNRLPLVTLEVAESIIAQYSCPKRLIDHFAKDPNAVQTLADIKIKRGHGPTPLQTERRIGNVLSNKLYTLYNTRDPNALI